MALLHFQVLIIFFWEKHISNLNQVIKPKIISLKYLQEKKMLM